MQILPHRFRGFHYSNINTTFVENSFGHCVKVVRIRSFSAPYFPTFGLNLEIYRVNLRIQFECGKIRIRKTPNTDTFYAMNKTDFQSSSKVLLLKEFCNLATLGSNMMALQNFHWNPFYLFSFYKLKKHYKLYFPNLYNMRCWILYCALGIIANCKFANWGYIKPWGHWKCLFNKTDIQTFCFTFALTSVHFWGELQRFAYVGKQKTKC